MAAQLLLVQPKAALVAVVQLLREQAGQVLALQNLAVLVAQGLLQQ
jgi:hypothetical protein